LANAAVLMGLTTEDKIRRIEGALVEEVAASVSFPRPKIPPGKPDRGRQLCLLLYLLRTAGYSRGRQVGFFAPNGRFSRGGEMYGNFKKATQACKAGTPGRGQPMRRRHWHFILSYRQWKKSESLRYQKIRWISS